MNYYRRYIGDYARDTAHLSLMEHGAYTLLLDVQYATEKPLPNDIDRLCRLCRAVDADEKDAVQEIVNQFFPINGIGRENKRAKSEVIAGRSAIDKMSAAGVEGSKIRWGSDHATESKTRAQRLSAARLKGTHTDEEWYALAEFCCHVCVKCGSGKSVVKDHITPIYMGGSDAIENIQPLCRSCNAGKGQETIDYRANGWGEAIKTPKVGRHQTPKVGLGSRLDPPTTNHQPPRSNRQDKDTTASNESNEFKQAWEMYPKRAGANPKGRALKAWGARIKDDVAITALTDGLDRYRYWCRETGKLNTEFVMQAATFFGPDEHYLETWSIPDAKPEKECLTERVRRKSEEWGKQQSGMVLDSDGRILRP